jgi:hypothetical protein
MMQHRSKGWGGMQVLLIVASLAALPGIATSQELGVEPTFSIWDVQLGQPVSEVPDSAAAIIACGTNGGPTSIELKSFGDWEQCTPEASGLREVAFVYDDEQDYIARALELEYRALSGGTSMYARPVVVSILVDDKGVAQGIRVVTDDRASDNDRRLAVVLIDNLQARFSPWNLDCQDIPMRPGEQPVGLRFVHELCTGSNPDGSGQRVLIEGSYLRKKGQEGLNRETQQVNTGYFESKTRLEVVNPPYSPSAGP